MPATEYQARTSLPYAIASAIIDGAVGIDTFDETNLRRREVSEVLDRIRYEPADDLDGFDAVVEIRRASGVTDTLRPPSSEQSITEFVGAKLPYTAGRVLDEARLAEFAGALAAAEKGDTFDPIKLVLRLRTSEKRTVMPRSGEGVGAGTPQSDPGKA
jgi:hypothetical protein